MTDLKDLVDGASSKAALAAGKELAKRALDDLTLSDEERAAGDEVKSGDRKKALLKYGVIGVLGVVLVLSLMSVLAKLWVYALGLLVVAGVGGAGYLYVKPKVKALQAKASARLHAKSDAAAKVAVEQALLAAEQAKLDAVAAKKQKLEDELMALKRKA